jgi:segregation and condensation protein A
MDPWHLDGDDQGSTTESPPTAETPPTETVPEPSAGAASGGEGFEDAPPRGANDDELVLDLDGFEGPIDALLTLARDQKVDLRKISILELADQYLAFIARARRLRLEIAADYLVMAAWLAYLKSRLLLPEPPADGEPSGAELAAALAFQLQRLEAMQEAGKNLMALPQFGRDFFARGAPEPVKIVDVPVWDVTLFDLLKAYGTHPGRRREGLLRIAPLNLFSMDDALKRIGDMLGHALDWTVLRNFLPEGMDTPLQRRAALAATFAATLELARDGKIELRQEGVFGQIYLRRSTRRDEPSATELQQG